MKQWLRVAACTGEKQWGTGENNRMDQKERRFKVQFWRGKCKEETRLWRSQTWSHQHFPYVRTVGTNESVGPPYFVLTERPLTSLQINTFDEIKKCWSCSADKENKKNMTVCYLKKTVMALFIYLYLSRKKINNIWILVQLIKCGLIMIYDNEINQLS